MAAIVQSPLVYAAAGVPPGIDVVELLGLVKDEDDIEGEIRDLDEDEDVGAVQAVIVTVYVAPDQSSQAVGREETFITILARTRLWKKLDNAMVF